MNKKSSFLSVCAHVTLEIPSATLEDHFGRFVITFQKAGSGSALKIVSRASLIVVN